MIDNSLDELPLNVSLAGERPAGNPFSFDSLLKEISTKDAEVLAATDNMVAITFCKYFRDHPNAIFIIAAPNKNLINLDMWCSEFAGLNIISRIDLDYIKSRLNSSQLKSSGTPDFEAAEQTLNNVLNAKASSLVDTPLGNFSLPFYELDDPELVNTLSLLTPKDFSNIVKLPSFSRCSLLKFVPFDGGLLTKKSFDFILSKRLLISTENLEASISKVELASKFGTKPLQAKNKKSI